MGISVSESFRQNCYDLSKKQRLVLRSGNMTLSNEDISVNGGVKFNLASITSTQQVQFGCTPCNTISVSILNEDGRITSDTIVGNEFHCDIGVESGTGTYEAPLTAISAVSTGDEYISVHAEAPYVRGNCTFGSLHPQLMYGYKCKIMYVYDILYFVIKNGTETYYAKHTKTGSHSYSVYTTPSDTECSILDKLMNEAPYDAICYYAGGIVEYTYDHEEGIVEGEWATASGSIVYITDALAHSMASWVVGLGQAPGEPYVPTSDFTSWSVLKTGTWGNAKNNTWGSYSGYSVFNTVIYESVPYGVWYFDRPRKVNSAVLTLNGKDRMVAFDEDSADFASSMPNTLISARNMIVAIANYKGVPVGNLDGLNELADTKMVNPSVYYQNKSLKDLLSYLFEVCGANCIIDREGKLSASNSENVAVELPFVYSFDVADYTAHTIKDMLIYREGEYTQYQTDEELEDGVRYDWNDNPFFDTIVLDGSWFSEGVNVKYGGFRNAITTAQADYSLWCDDVYSWTDEDETLHREPIFSMSVEWNGNGMVTYTNYGEEERQYASYGNRIEGVTSTNDVNLQGYNQAKYNDKLDFSANGLTVNSNGLRIKNAAGQTVFDADTNGNLLITGKLQGATGTFSGQLQAASGDFEGVVIADEGRIGKWEIVGDNLKMTDVDNTTNNVELGIVNVDGADRVAVKTTGAATNGDILDTVMYHNGVFFRANGENRALIRNGAFGLVPNITFQTGVVGGDCGLNILCSGDLTISGKSVSISSSQDELYIDNPSVISGIGQATSGANAVLAAVSGGHKLYINTSLRAVKDNIKTIENASESVDNLRGVSFTSKCDGDDPNRTYYGFIAEEVEEAVPELASYANGKLQSVQYDRVCALLVEDNKACHRRIEELERRLADLEKRLK